MLYLVGFLREHINERKSLYIQNLATVVSLTDNICYRKMLIEAITQLCTEKKNREYIRDNGTYLIMRELHKWEKDPNVIIAVENLVDILIR